MELLASLSLAMSPSPQTPLLTIQQPMGEPSGHDEFVTLLMPAVDLFLSPLLSLPTTRHSLVEGDAFGPILRVRSVTPALYHQGQGQGQDPAVPPPLLSFKGPA